MMRKPFIFVVMPFHPKFDDLYELGIKPACQSAGADCARIDEQIFNEEILARLYRQIQSAELVIGVMTDAKPNVYYEVGYAKGRDKRVVFVTENAEDIPFDLKGYRHIVYGGSITTLRKEVEKTVSHFLRPTDNEDPRSIAGIWKGEIVAEHPDPIFPRLPIAVEFRWIGTVDGHGTIEIPEQDPIRLHFSGGFRHDSYLMLTYENSDPGVMQFGATVLRINASAQMMQGHYVGYGSLNDTLVYGRVTLNRTRASLKGT